MDAGTVWSYLDTGVDPATGGDLDAWAAPDFDDAAWKSATGAFGAMRNVHENPIHGRFGVATKLEQYKPGTTTNVETFFLRTQVDLDADDLDGVGSFTADIAYDDAVRVFLNGEYVWGGRDDRFDTGAATNMQYVGGNDSAPREETFSIDAEQFVEGENTIAVALHNTNAGSSDIYLDLRSLEAVAAPDPDAPNPVTDLKLQLGSDDTQRNVAWMTERAGDGVVQWAPAEAMTGEEFPLAAASTSATVASGPAWDGRHYHHAVIDGLEPERSYVYRVGTGDANEGDFSDVATLRTFASDDGFDFLLMGDAQIGASGNRESDGRGWQRTLDVAQEMFPDAEFIHSVGDQVESHTNSEEYRHFLAPDNLRETPLTTVIGNHDNFTPAYRQQFFDPNVDESYGNDGNSGHSNGNSWFIYDDTLVMNLNSNTLYDTSSWPTHVEFVRKTMAEQGDRARWHVATLHHSLFSVANHSTNQQVVTMRNNLAPAFSELGVDVVLSGHDHSYARTKVLQGREPIDWPGTDEVYPQEGQTVYVTANSSSGSKYYNPRPAQQIADADPNGYDYIERRWQEYTPSFSHIQVRDDAMTVTTYETARRTVVDEVTIHLPGTPAPDPSTIPATPDPLPFPAAPAPLTEFDDETWGEVVFDDDFSADRLAEYTVYGGQTESVSELGVDTDRGLLTSTSAGRAWTQLALPTAAGQEFALIVEPETFLPGTTGENSLFLGLTNGPASRTHSWYNHNRGATNFDVQVSGWGYGSGVGDQSVRWESGDRMAAVMRDGELSSWIEKDGEWSRLSATNVYPKMSVEEAEGWAPTLSLRHEAGTLEIDRVTLLRPEPSPSDLLSDVDRYNQFHTEIAWLVDAGIATGWDNGDGTASYRPLADINRDAMAAFLYRKAGSPDVELPAISPFTDVAPDNQFYEEIVWLAQEGISTGWDNGDGTASFRPLEPIARDAMAAFLHREAGSPDVAVPTTSPFADVTPATQFYAEITWMQQSGIAQGWAGNDGRAYYAPLAPVARDAMAAFLHRAVHGAS
ncbi:fibronectin type III domain-containing protein [Litorihabitans aurantiacus]|uniref:fibronectin type III domain-containing protein n=1 Tax=Litorihabitans aurantiacus TaxID=1930061 RepID=UPI0024E0D85B|nr:fibronectin type III domain-containing protein [Litorihabitans aurantiacus]